MTPKQFAKNLLKQLEKIDIEMLMDNMEDVIVAIDEKIGVLEEKEKLTEKQEEKLELLQERRDYFDSTIREALDMIMEQRDELYGNTSEIEDWE